jgi:hypothetical protein
VVILFGFISDPNQPGFIPMLLKASIKLQLSTQSMNILPKRGNPHVIAVFQARHSRLFEAKGFSGSLL